MTDWTDKQIGKYEIKELLGRGGMGEVYKAYHPALQRDVAIKMIHTHIATDPEAIDRFRREARIVAALRHPGIVQVHDFDIEGDTFYMVMEFVPGQTLESRLRAIHAQNERMPLPEALRLFQLIGQAVTYAHSQGVVHLDLKPGNVLLFSPPGGPRGDGVTEGEQGNRRRARQPILADFGLSKIIGAERMADPGTISGTPSYISPEQCLGQVGDERSDIYSLGIMLYQLTTGALPFSGDTPVALIFKHIDEPPPPPRSLNPDLPEALEHLIQKTLAKNPTDRYQSAGAMLEALDEVVVPIGGVPSALLDVETTLPDAERTRCPYRGLQSFEEDHAEFYFGREALVERLVKQLQALVRPGKSANSIEESTGRFLAILGASGSGKSSLLQAGLIPALRAGALADGAAWSICLMKPGEQPLSELAAQLAPLLLSPSSPPLATEGRNEGGPEAGDGDRVKATRQLLDNLAADGRTLHLAVRLSSPFAPSQPPPPQSPPKGGRKWSRGGEAGGAGGWEATIAVGRRSVRGNLYPLPR